MNRTDVFLHEYEILNEYKWNNLPYYKFSYRKHKDPKSKRLKYLDDGHCECCGRRNQYLLIDKDYPKLCNDCYKAVVAYQNLWVDVLRLKKKKKLNLKDCKRIQSYMKKYARNKSLAIAIAGSLIGTTLSNKLLKN